MIILRVVFFIMENKNRWYNNELIVRDRGVRCVGGLDMHDVNIIVNLKRADNPGGRFAGV